MKFVIQSELGCGVWTLIMKALGLVSVVFYDAYVNHFVVLVSLHIVVCSLLGRLL